MKIAIIGAGPAGLVAAKYSLQQGHECVVFEQTGQIGGTWVYTDFIGLDEEGVCIHTSMYKNLTTNFPKELMMYADFPFPEDKIESYISQEEVLEYLHEYANKFHLKNVVRFFERVTSISPTGTGKWMVTTKNVKTDSAYAQEYDATFICNGRYFCGVIPEIPGQNLFRGTQVHSREFRIAEPFKNQRVLIIGGSYSGIELAPRIGEVAKSVHLSHRKPLIVQMPDNVVLKPEVKKINEDGAVFQDGSEETFDTIVYCTGFEYKCPFLTKECGLIVEDNWVRPLYKHIINIEYPTMYVIGMPYISCGIPMFDYQVRFALASLEKRFHLPTKSDMLKELEERMKNRREKNLPDREAHVLGNAEAQSSYFQELSDVSGIPPPPPVISKLFGRIKTCTKLKCRFKLVDDDNYIVV